MTTPNPFKKASDLGGGAFFKPADHMTDLALLIEPKRIDKDVDSTYQGTTRVRDEVTADITVFKTQESLDKGEPTEVLKAVKVVHGMLTSSLEKVLADGPNGAMLGIVRKIPTKAGSGYAFRDPEADAEGKVFTFYTKRESEAAEAVAEAPSFE